MILAVSSGAMLGAAFPPSPAHSLAYVGLIPLLLLLETLDTTWSKLRYSYLSLLILHVITLYWIGGFVVGKDVWMMVAGGAVLIVHPLFYSVVIFLYVLVRNRMGLVPGLIFLVLGWVGFEYSHSLTEFSFPWITLGNSQAYDLQRMQIAEFTSSYGLSFLILLFNAVGFVLISNLAARRWRYRSRPALLACSMLLVIYFIPWLYGSLKMRSVGEMNDGRKVSVGIVQPNIDPWEKWNSGGGNPWPSYERQLEGYVRESKTLSAAHPDLIVWPETAIPFRILLPGNQMYWRWLRTSLDSARATVLTGLPFTVFYDSASAPPSASYDRFHHTFYDDYNSAALLVPGEPVGSVYKKIVLVPFAERIPYANTLNFLIEPLKWNVGIGMWGKGKDTVLFSLRTPESRELKFASMICYESVYPNFVREFVQRGASFLVIITNDSWWGNTPGA
ncbi:MAG TPA: apolipoprotein N-acyltransferase, partial [Bacteroidota bacterium]|nr:apolipoprotein N-acyltransferase [Bacteroidota bacterium]